MSQPFVKVRIGTEADASEVRAYEDRLRSLDRTAGDFVNTLKMGVGIDFGGKIVGALAQGPAMLQQWVQRGVEFNVGMADAQVAIANVVQKFAGLNSEAAKGEAAKAMAKIVEIEPQAAGSMQDLVGGLLATVGSAQAAGIGIEKNVILVGKFANALANANIPAEQLSQEMRAIFTGNITPDASLAKILQITNEDVERAKGAGNLFEMLSEKIGALGEAGDTFGVKFSSLSSAFDKAMGALAQGTTQELAQASAALANGLGDPETIRVMQELGVSIGEIVRSGAALLQWAVANADALASLAKVAGIAGVALAAMKIKDIVIGLGLKLLALNRSTAAVAAETTAVNANTVAHERNATARAGGGLGGAGAAGALSKIANGAIVGAGVGEVLAWGFNKMGDSTVRRANEGAEASRDRPSNLRAQVAAATTLEAKTAAMKALDEEILHLAEEKLKTDGVERYNIDQQLNATRAIKRDFDAIAGSAERNAETQRRNAARLTEEQSKQMEFAHEEARIAALKASGFDEAADAAERELEIRKQIAALMKANPNFKEAEASTIIRDQMAGVNLARDSAKLGAARLGFRDATEKPEDRLARLQGDFEKVTGKAAPADATAGTLGEMAAGNAKGLDIARQILDVQRQINDATNQAGDEARRGLEESIQRANRLQEAKEAVDSELEIQQALASGDKERARSLELERETRQKIKELQEQGLTLEQATEKARDLATAKLKTERAEKQQSRDLASAELAVETAKGGPSKQAVRDAETNLFRKQTQKKFEDAGFSRDEAASLTDQAADARERQQRRAAGTIGGRARRSSRDTLGGGVDNLASLRTPLAERIATTPEAKGGKPSEASGQKPELGGDAVKGAAAETKAAAAELKAAATDLKNAMSAIRTEVSELRSELQGAISRETGR